MTSITFNFLPAPVLARVLCGAVRESTPMAGLKNRRLTHAAGRTISNESGGVEATRNREVGYMPKSGTQGDDGQYIKRSIAGNQVRPALTPTPTEASA